MMAEPSTEAGRKLLDGHYPSGVRFKEQMREYLLRSILAIEAEVLGSVPVEWEHRLSEGYEGEPVYEHLPAHRPPGEPLDWAWTSCDCVERLAALKGATR